MRSHYLNFDGSAERNPGGPGGWGWRLSDAAGVLVASDLGRTPAGPGVTNNTEEWRGLLMGLEYLATYPELFDRVTVGWDSKMVVMQAAGEWKAKADHLKPLLARCRGLLERIGWDRVRFQWVPREQNAECDELSKGCGQPYLPSREPKPSPEAAAPPATPDGVRAAGTFTPRTDFVRAVDCRP